LLALHCAAAARGVLIEKEERINKENSWVKLKAFPTNVGPPNNIVNIKKTIKGGNCEALQLEGRQL